MDFKEPYPEDEGSYTDELWDAADVAYERRMDGFYE